MKITKITKKVLVVEAVLDSLNLVNSILRRGDYVVITVGDASLFPAVLRKHPNADMVFAGLRPSQNGGLNVLTMAKRFLPNADRYLLAAPDDITDEVIAAIDEIGIKKTFDYKDLRTTLIAEGIVPSPDVLPDRVMTQAT